MRISVDYVRACASGLDVQDVIEEHVKGGDALFIGAKEGRWNCRYTKSGARDVASVFASWTDPSIFHVV